MAEKKKSKGAETKAAEAKPASVSAPAGDGGETHQTASAQGQTLTTAQGIPVSDDQNSLKAGARGPTLLEDFVLREKITHFDHERIPERIVHARGSGAHGYFQPTKSLRHLTRAAFLQDPAKKTEVFARFSTVAGGAGSVDTPRDVRGFAVKFYTEEGNFDLVGNNIPVFFIQDAIKFPDLIHSVKMEPDRGFPQAASAHDTFWDFISLMPESLHMIMWAMSDRAIPRSLRMIEGFGIHTFRLVNAEGKSTFVKFHWRPTIGAASTLWDEAVKIAGADPDFHRRDLWESIERGDYPEWELAIQAFDEETAKRLPYDVLDSTKLIPEEDIPLEVIGRMVLNRNPDNFFAETEQVAFCPGNLVPGVDVSDDPLLQGRLFSYLDTQLSRLGGPNFHQIPINRPRCPMHNLLRDGHMQMEVPKGRVAYEPNSLDPSGPRECPVKGFKSFPESLEGASKVRARSETFSDHYSQARLFFRSMTDPEQRHMVGALGFELGKVETVAIRQRMLGHLDVIDPDLGRRVAEALGMQGQATPATPARAPVDMKPSPALSIVSKAPTTLKGRMVGLLVADGVDGDLVAKMKSAVMKEGARVAVVAPKIGGVKTATGDRLDVDHAIDAAPSVFFDAVAVLASKDGGEALSKKAPAVNFVSDAFAHLKVIGHTADAKPLLDKGNVMADAGVIDLGAKGVDAFITAAKGQRVWAREPKLEIH
ncbi:MAG: catalase [Polyangiales bacterium]